MEQGLGCEVDGNGQESNLIMGFDISGYA